MKPIFLWSGILLLSLLVAAGCSDDPTTPPPGEEPSVRVDLEPGGADFTIELKSVMTPEGRIEGPFALRGQNLHYNDVIGALVVDLTIANHSPVTFFNPVHITFLRLFPEGTIILNSPDDGPTFEFDFANDDLWWTPGEESLPLTVMFKADLGVSVGFYSQISVGGVHLEGMIGGRVWNDLNRNRFMDPDEPGLADLLIRLDDGSDHENLVLAQTGPDGRFLFRDLDAGTYELWVTDPPGNMVSTTPLSMHVLLTTDMGGVSTFTEANFGFAPRENHLPGPQLIVRGNHMNPFIAYRGENVLDLRVPFGVPLHFGWQGSAEPGLEIQAYRWGWNVVDPSDPQDPGWQQSEPGLGPGYTEAHWEAPLEPGQMYTLVIQCWDNADHLTRAIINFQVSEPGTR